MYQENVPTCAFIQYSKSPIPSSKNQNLLVLSFFLIAAPGMILTLPPEEEEIEVQQLLATKDTNGKVNHVIVKEQDKQPV